MQKFNFFPCTYINPFEKQTGKSFIFKKDFKLSFSPKTRYLKPNMFTSAFHVKRFDCGNCNKSFKAYYREGKLSHTIPKAK